MAFGLAVVGLEHWYTAFGLIEMGLKSERVPLRKVVETRSERRQQAQDRFPGVAMTGELNEALTDPEIQLIAICTTTQRAPEIACACLRAGKQVLSVKPPACSLAELEHVLEVARDAKRFFGSLESIQRLHPRVILLRDLIRQGVIGTPVSFHQMGHGGLPQPWPGETGSSWWLDSEHVPGGAWIDHAIYGVDLARFVFQGEITFATGLIEKRVHTGLSVEDYGIALMRLQPKEGPPVSLIFEDTWLAEPGRGAHQQLILGTQGKITAEGAFWVVVQGNDKTRHPVPDWQYFNLEPLADLLEMNQVIPFGPEDARANLAACLAVYQAASTPEPTQ